MPLTRREEIYQITRTTYTILKPFDAVLAKLDSTIKSQGTSHDPRTIAQASGTGREQFESTVHSLAGPHGFLQFAVYDHGAWIPLYGVGEGRKVVRVVFGNPLILLNMIRHDLRAGLHAPLDAILIERADGEGVDVVQVRPSSIIAGYEGAERELGEAARELDHKVEALWEWVAA